MAYEFLKKFFGTPKDGEEPKAMTYAQLEAAIDADKKIQVVDVKAGGYVSKEKLDAKITELDGVRQQLTDANAEIKSTKRWILMASKSLQKTGKISTTMIPSSSMISWLNRKEITRWTDIWTLSD